MTCHVLFVPPITTWKREIWWKEIHLKCRLVLASRVTRFRAIQNSSCCAVSKSIFHHICDISLDRRIMGKEQSVVDIKIATLPKCYSWAFSVARDKKRRFLSGTFCFDTTSRISVTNFIIYYQENTLLLFHGNHSFITGFIRKLRCTYSGKSNVVPNFLVYFFKVKFWICFYFFILIRIFSVQITDVLFLLSFRSCFFLNLRSKYSPQHFVLR
jgi:hypothetical protein